MYKQHQFFKAADDRRGQASFCPNCGQAVAATDEFCPNCGFKLHATTDQPSPSVNTAQSTTSSTRKVRQLPQRHMPTWGWGLIAVIVVILIGGYLYGQNYYQPLNQLDRDLTALKTGKGLAKQVTSTDPSLKITNDSVKPMVTYFKNNRKSLASLASSLKSRSATNDYGIQFVKTGKSWLFFDKYQLQVTSVYATLATNHRNVALSVNGKHVATSNKATYEHKIGPYVPGSYTLTAKGTVSGHQITNKGTYYLRANGQTYDLDLRTISFTVNGTPNTTVYINGENEGTINSSGTLALNDIPWSNRMMLTGKYKAGSQTLTAKQTNVSDAEGQDVDLKFAGVMSKDTASDYLNGIFTAVSSYTSTGDLSDASDYDDRTLDDYFVNGTDNTDYKELVQMAKGYYDNDDVLDVTYEPTVLSTVPAAKQQSQITYDVKYDFTNSEDERIQVFRYTATVEKTGGHYKIVKITPAQKIRSYTKSDDSDD